MDLANFYKRSALLACTFPLLLVGCGEYERVAYEGFPYSNSRTAGSGVAYVYKKMMPKKGPKVELKAEDALSELTPPPDPVPVVPPEEPKPEPVAEVVEPLTPLVEDDKKAEMKLEPLDTKVDEKIEHAFNAAQRK